MTVFYCPCGLRAHVQEDTPPMSADDPDELLVRPAALNLRPYRVIAPEHGTYRGYQWHHRHGETPCDSCLAAKAAYCRDYRALRRQRAATRAATATKRAAS